jgi:hypothetical protein
MTSTVPRVTVEEARVLRKCGDPWGPWVLLERPPGSPVISLTLGDLRILRKYGRTYEPVAFLLWLARRDTRRLLAFLAAMVHRNHQAAQLAAFLSKLPATPERPPPRWRLLSRVVPDRAPPACLGGAAAMRRLPGGLGP